MREQKSLYEMDDRERRRYLRAIRLRRERRRKCAVGLLGAFVTLCMVSICFMSYRSIRIHASDGFKYYTSITVETGDSLWNLAEEYADEAHYEDLEGYISEVCSINHLADADDVAAGQMLILPYYEAEYVR